jgi:hypothetical protein
LYFEFKSESRLLNITRYLLCCRVLRVARHPRCRGDDLLQPVHLLRGCHHLRQDSSRLQVQASGALPPHPYPGQPSDTPPPEPSQGYWPSPMPWGAPPKGQASPPFGTPPWMTSHRPTSTPPSVKQACAKLCFICILDCFTFLTC